MAIDEVIARLDLVQLIDSYIPLKKKGVNFVACCPFHHEKTPSFNVIPKKQFYYCFGCGASGNAISFIMQYKQLGFIEAVEELAESLGLTLVKEEKFTHKKQKKSPNAYHLLQEIKDFYSQCLKKSPNDAETYLKTRGVTKNISDLFELGYAREEWHLLENTFKKEQQNLELTGMLVKKDNGKIYDRYRHRLMFPIHDRQGRVVGFGGRVLEKDAEPKYMNSPESPIFHKGRELYGLYQLLAHKDYKGPIIVVEGYMDVIALVQHGIFYTVATLGTATTINHLQLLAKYTNEVIFCFDGDEAGFKAALRALEHSLPMMDGSLELKFMFLPENEDPDSFIRKSGQNEFINFMQNAKPFADFWLDTLKAPKAGKTLAGRSQLLKEATSALTQMPDGPYKFLLIDQLARASRVSLEEIQHIISGKSAAKSSTIHITRSPLRLAIALILQYPKDCHSMLNDAVLEAEDEQGLEVLQGLITQLKSSPNATTAQLIEPWRTSTWFEPLQKLAAWEHQVPENNIAQEFSDLLSFLNKQNFAKEIDYYMSKLRKTGLSKEEQVHLQNLLKLKHCKSAP